MPTRPLRTSLLPPATTKPLLRIGSRGRTATSSRIDPTSSTPLSGCAGRRIGPSTADRIRTLLQPMRGHE